MQSCGSPILHMPARKSPCCRSKRLGARFPGNRSIGRPYSMAGRQVHLRPGGDFLRRGPESGIFSPRSATVRRIIDVQPAGINVFAKINHVAIVSEKYALLASFYESLFGMKRSPKGK